MVQYEYLSKGEDTPVLHQLLENEKLVVVYQPDLYVYYVHGTNTWGNEHFQNMISKSLPLTNDEAERVLTKMMIE